MKRKMQVNVSDCSQSRFFSTLCLIYIFAQIYRPGTLVLVKQTLCITNQVKSSNEQRVVQTNGLRKFDARLFQCHRGCSQPLETVPALSFIPNKFTKYSAIEYLLFCVFCSENFTLPLVS